MHDLTTVNYGKNLKNVCQKAYTMEMNTKESASKREQIFSRDHIIGLTLNCISLAKLFKIMHAIK